MSVTEHLDSLKAKHLDLEQLIEQEEARPRPDEAKIHELKRPFRGFSRSPSGPPFGWVGDQGPAVSQPLGDHRAGTNRRIPIWLLS
jgi:hypothetical protein